MIVVTWSTVALLVIVQPIQIMAGLPGLPFTAIHKNSVTIAWTIKPLGYMPGQQTRFLNIDICTSTDLATSKEGNQTHLLLPVASPPDTGLVIEIISRTRVEVEIQTRTWLVLKLIR